MKTCESCAELRKRIDLLETVAKLAAESIIPCDWNMQQELRTALEAAGIEIELKSYAEKFGDDRLCACGHSYYRHFDTYEHMSPVGCKYCECRVWKSPEDKQDANDNKVLGKAELPVVAEQRVDVEDGQCP